MFRTFTASTAAWPIGTFGDNIIYIKGYIIIRITLPLWKKVTISHVSAPSQFVGHWFWTLNSHSFHFQPACKVARLICSSYPFRDKMRWRGLKDSHLENWFILNIFKEMSRLEFCWYSFIRKEPRISVLLVWSGILLTSQTILHSPCLTPYKY